ncbi:hypothetical protein PV325_003770 [Microctonus aethiopoides]|nr:hypothetical protein PV325_003770 [Microctonus aethiopoides]
MTNRRDDSQSRWDGGDEKRFRKMRGGEDEEEENEEDDEKRWKSAGGWYGCPRWIRAPLCLREEAEEGR